MSPLADIGIVAAMEMEIRPLVRSWQRETISLSGRTITVYRKGSTVATCCGPTVVNARTSTKVLVETYAPKMLLSVGFAGSLDATVRVPEIVVPERVVDADSARSFSTVAGNGVLVTANKVVGTAEKVQLASRWAAHAVDMEAAGVAEVAVANKCRFAAVKAISDDASTEMDFVGRFVEPSGFRTCAFLAYVALRPRLWPAVRQLRINSERASSNLCSALAYILSSSQGVVGALATFAREHAGSRA